jgi:hypothetical protein
MPIENEDATRVFGKLASALRENKLEWVLEQVNETIAAGKPAVKRVKALESGGDWRGVALRPGREAEFRTTLEYSPQEQLEIVLRAIRQAVLVTAEMERVVGHQFPGTRFVSERGELELQISESTGREKPLHVLSDAIDRLTREIT